MSRGAGCYHSGIPGAPVRLVPLLALTLPGCVTMGTLQRADTLGAGGYEIGVEPGAWGAGAGGTGTVLPSVAVSARIGVSDRTDIGFRVGSNGIDLGFKQQLTAPGTDGVVLSLAPQLGGFFIGAGEGAAGLYHVQVPVLIGVPTPGDSQLVLSPKLHWLGALASASGDGGSVGLLSLGGGVGYAARLSPAVQLLPEVTALVPVVATASSNGSSETSAIEEAGVLYQVGLSVLIGRKGDAGGP